MTVKHFVTGAAGMIGSNVSRALVRAGHHVVGVDNLWRGKLANLRDILDNPNFEFRHADIGSDLEWYRGMSAKSTMVHTADIVAGIGYVLGNEWAVFQKNNLINTQIARIARYPGCAHLIYLGTACSYPQSLQRSTDASVLSEKDKFPADPESGYGWSKLIGEIEFRLALKGTETRFTVLDLHNVYGWPCVYEDNTAQVIPALINKGMNSTDRTLTVWGDGKQGRAFLHVEDVVQAIVRAMNYAGELSNFMIGPERCTTISEVAQLIKRHEEIQVEEILYDTTKPVGDIGRYADPGLAGKELGWKAEVPFETGLHGLIDRILEHHRSGH